MDCLQQFLSLIFLAESRNRDNFSKHYKDLRATTFYSISVISWLCPQKTLHLFLEMPGFYKPFHGSTRIKLQFQLQVLRIRKRNWPYNSIIQDLPKANRREPLVLSLTNVGYVIKSASYDPLVFLCSELLKQSTSGSESS